MRYLGILLAVACLFPQLAPASEQTDFESFMESREVVDTLYFEVNSDSVDARSRQRLAETAARLRELQSSGRMIRVEGYSSPEGDKEANFRLSFFRARAVAELIEVKGLPAGIALTGYGDLQAASDDPSRERRVEIVSYIKPVGMKKVKVSSKKEDPVADASAVEPERATSPEIDSYRVDQAIKAKLEERNKNLAERNKNVAPALSNGLSRAAGAEESIIDALMIEQAIMEKIGSVPAPASDATVSQVDPDY
jgi:hypothetical protein